MQNFHVGRSRPFQMGKCCGIGRYRQHADREVRFSEPSFKAITHVVFGDEFIHGYILPPLQESGFALLWLRKDAFALLQSSQAGLPDFAALVVGRRVAAARKTGIDCGAGRIVGRGLLLRFVLTQLLRHFGSDSTQNLCCGSPVDLSHNPLFYANAQSRIELIAPAVADPAADARVALSA